MTSVVLQGRVADSSPTAGPHPGWYLYHRFGEAVIRDASVCLG
ncbi:MAG: DUF1446 domain-containing protein [Caldilineaceae bacterium SB0661_bin_34]|nr:DUF1446 domain-containing protein [Caldilineaceae bacterium SB0661_bin_34]